MTALKAGCMKEKSPAEWEYKGGEMELDEDRLKYLKEIAMKRIDAGISGGLAEGYDVLMEALDPA
jgi:hypothetical protein